MSNCCPNCGYCEKCGRSNQPYPYVRPYPYPYRYPYWQIPNTNPYWYGPTYTITCSTGTNSQTWT